MASKYVLRLLTTWQKQGCLEAFPGLKDEFRNYPNVLPRSLQLTIRGTIDTILKLSNNQTYGILQIHFAPKKLVRSKIKTMLVCFFDVRRFVHSKFFPPGQAVIQAFYLKILKILHDSLRRKRSDLWQLKDWVFHHDNAPVAHSPPCKPTFNQKWFFHCVPSSFFPRSSPPTTSFYFPEWRSTWKESV